jgi:hypothetical protein
MEYSELKNIIFTPFADFIDDIKKKQQGDIFPAREENGLLVRIYPNGSLDNELNRFRKNHKPILDARLLFGDFIKQLEPDLKKDIVNDIGHHIRKLIFALHKIRGEQEMNYIFPFVDEMLEYLRTLKTMLRQAPGQKQKKPYKAKYRAYGIFFYLLYEREDNKLIWGDPTAIKEKIKELGCDDVKRAAEVARGIFRRPETLDKYKLDPETARDYFHAIDLFKAKYPEG